MKLRKDSGGMRSTYARGQAFLAGETITGGSFECERCDFRLDKETGKVTNLPVCPHCQGDRWKAA